MSGQVTRARRRPCKVCGASEAQHELIEFKTPHTYTPIDPTPHGTHQTPRATIKIPDPDGHAEAWRAVADREGVTLGELALKALDAYCGRAQHELGEDH